MNTYIHRRYVLPSIDKYDECADPSDHINAFNFIIRVDQLSSPTKCPLFLSTPKELADCWFLHLQSDSIHSWTKLCANFKTMFFTSRTHVMMASELGNVRHRPTESLRSYVDYFNKESTRLVTRTT